MASGRGYTKSGLTVIAGYVNVIIKAFQRVTFFKFLTSYFFDSAQRCYNVKNLDLKRSRSYRYAQ